MFGGTDKLVALQRRTERALEKASTRVPTKGIARKGSKALRVLLREYLHRAVGAEEAGDLSRGHMLRLAIQDIVSVLDRRGDPVFIIGELGDNEDDPTAPIRGIRVYKDLTEMEYAVVFLDPQFYLSEGSAKGRVALFAHGVRPVTGMITMGVFPEKRRLSTYKLMPVFWQELNQVQQDAFLDKIREFGFFVAEPTTLRGFGNGGSKLKDAVFGRRCREDWGFYLESAGEYIGFDAASYAMGDDLAQRMLFGSLGKQDYRQVKTVEDVYELTESLIEKFAVAYLRREYNSGPRTRGHAALNLEGVFDAMRKPHHLTRADFEEFEACWPHLDTTLLKDGFYAGFVEGVRDQVESELVALIHGYVDVEEDY